MLVKAAGLPDHNHSFVLYHDTAGDNGYDKICNYNRAVTYNTKNASLSNPIYGRSDTVQPPAIVSILQIKF